ncbi:hypothetical protein KCU65_g5853, partial [Aureobasidium melanogenum]
MNLYVELAEPSTPSTTSSSSSTTPFTTLSTSVNTASPTPYFSTTSSLNISSTVSPIVLSTGSPITAYNVSSNASTTASTTESPTVAPTCTLIPNLPNSGFEDGKNQTAWSIARSYHSSWAPTTTNPYAGTLSGQVTFTSEANFDQPYLYLTNTLSNLCPGFNYSISYSSFCDVPDGSNCYLSVSASESLEDEIYYDTDRPGTGWLSRDDITEFTAAKSTTILYVYVSTTMPNEDVGNVFLDGFSIALIGDKTRVYEEG